MHDQKCARHLNETEICYNAGQCDVVEQIDNFDSDDFNPLNHRYFFDSGIGRILSNHNDKVFKEDPKQGNHHVKEGCVNVLVFMNGFRILFWIEQDQRGHF